LAQYIRQADIKHYPSEDYLSNLVKNRNTENFSLQLIGFKETSGMFTPPMINEEKLQTYAATRDFPASDSTSRLSVHLRFGTISVRQVVKKAMQLSKTWLNELIWREFFMQILWNFPTVEKEAFNAKYKYINWLNREEDFIRWTKGETGYALVDAGMHELNETGFMHNRVRMVTAGFLVKHLLVNWQWGEAYFAEKLLDFELSSNNGNWQWAAGTGCDAAPYFRIFNPENQAVKYDAEHQYIRKWIPGYKPEKYIPKIVDHTFARWRCLETYRKSSNSQ
jgi:deoxyribodipyrimidine photo-lyase